MKTTARFFILFIFTLLSVLECFACPDIGGLVDLNCDGRLIIAAFGDSITYGTGDTEHKGGYTGRLELIFVNSDVADLGKTGETTSKGKNRATVVLPQISAMDYSIILEGVNDYWEKKHSASQTKANLQSIMRTANNLGGLPLLASLTNTTRKNQSSWVKQVNSAIAGIKTIDFYSLGKGIISGDQLHPNSAGYAVMANYAASILRQISEQHRPIDSDSDGLYDWEEFSRQTNPYSSDTDEDGILDGLEVHTYHSNPLSLDSDADGYSDYQEVFIMNSNPVDARPCAPFIRSIQAVVN